jgi:hypothetical protein
LRRLDSPLVITLILAVYLVLGLSTAVTRAPWTDEGWFGNPAWNLAHRGFFGTTVLDPASSTWKNVRLTGIDRHTYWVMPLSLLLDSAVFRFFGFRTFAMRVPSLIFGIMFLLAWRAILRRLGASPALVALALLLIAVDFHFQSQAADGRMDAMAVAFGYSAIAAYLTLRERNLKSSILASHTLAAIAVFSHPNGAVPALLLVLATLYFDRRGLTFGAAALGALPYLVFAAGWGLYIAQDPAAWRAQFLGNASGRGPIITTPLAALKLEIVNRYLNNFGLAPWTSRSGRLNLIPLLILLGGTAVCFLSREIRRHPGYRLLLAATAITACYLTWFEGLKTPFYLLFLTPLYSALCAVAAVWLWNTRPRTRAPVAAALAVLVLLQSTRTLVIAARNPKAASFDPAVEFLRGHYTPDTFIMGNASLLFGLTPEWNLLDDFRLGYNTGKRPAVIVIDESWQDRIGMLREFDMAIWQHTQDVLASYREVYNRDGFRILERVR